MKRKKKEDTPYFLTRFDTYRMAQEYVKKNGLPLLDFQIPAGKQGGFEITNEKYYTGHAFSVCDARTALYTGTSPLQLKLDRHWTKTTLISEEHGTWMSTHPSEIYTQIYPILKAHGSVLIGGLGLGVAPTGMLALNPNVRNITCVELERDVIDLVSPHIVNDCLVVLQKNLFQYLEQTEQKYDYCYFDIWQGRGGETDFYAIVLPLRKLARRVLKKPERYRDSIYCWMEEVMRGQVIECLLTLKSFLKFDEVINQPVWTEFHRVPYTFILHYGVEKLKKMDFGEYRKRAIDYVLNYEEE